MNRYLPLLADRVLNKPLLITQTKLDAIMAVLCPRLGLGGQPVVVDMENHQPDATMGTFSLSAYDPATGQMAAEAVTMGLITVHGTLVHRANGMAGWSGLRAYDSIREDFRALRADSSVQGIIFEYDSGGGEACGLFDLVDELYAARDEIPMFAIINEESCSAAYALASAQDEIFLTRTSNAGSIGTRMKHVDRSKMNEAAGLKITEIAIGDRKLDGSPDAPLSDPAREIFTAHARQTNDLFVQVVARNRNLSEKHVRDLNAGFFQGEHAVSAGLADAVLSYDAALQRAAAKIATANGGTNMSTGLQNQFGALMKGAEEPEITAALAAHGYIPKGASAPVAGPDQGALDQAKTEAAATAKKEALDYAGQIIGLCSLARLPHLAAGFIKENLAVDAARQKLVDEQAKNGASEEITTTVSAASSGKISPLVEEARRRSDLAAKP
jgi:ClpP class serine protease